ncbi:MAG: fatty acid desaturase [Nostoc sp.]|uniref:fatty acid desaturase n=1 Tax=Nostoc sp. TaxID=1180 RepID=UPI002FF64855
MRFKIKTFSESEGKAWLNHKLILDIFVMNYTILGLFIGLYLILLDQFWLNLLGTILITHTSIWAALLTHEFIHDTIFQKPKINYGFGVLMTIISGACYVRYTLLKYQHLEHHRHKVGI